MKIAILVSDLTISGGFEKLTLRLGIELNKMGHQVIIYTPNLDRKTCYPNIFKSFPKIKVIGLNKKGRFNKTIYSIFDFVMPQLITNFAISRKVKECDLLIIQNEEFLIQLPFLKRNQNKFDTAIWMLNNQLSMNSFSLKKRLIEHVGVIKNIRIIPYIVLTLPAIIIQTYLKNLGLKYIDKTACYDSFNCRLVKQVLHIKSDVVFAGADLNEYKHIYAAKIDKNTTINILSVGVMFPYRRYEDIISAINLLKNDGINITLSIVGKTAYAKDYYKKLTSLTKKYGLTQNVIFHEYAEQQKLFSIYEKSHIFCFVNNAETWGISVFEAVATGMPVIITNNIGAADIIKSGESGWVVPPKNPKAIAFAIKDIINNPHRTKKTTIAAKTKIIKLLSWKGYAKRLLSGI